MGRHQRMVVKVGSQVLCDTEGHLDVDRLTALVAQLASLRQAGRQVLLVSSGAVAAGSGLLGPQSGLSNPVIRKQVLAAAGQARLMETYRRLFREHGLDVAQVLATKSDFQSRAHYLNMRGCIEGVLEAERLVGVHRACDVDEDLREVSIDAPVVGLVGIGQRGPGDPTAETHGIELVRHRAQAGLDVAEALAIG